MALQAELSLDIAVYGDTAKMNCLSQTRFDDKVLDGMTEEANGRLVLAALADDTEFNFQTVAEGKLVVIQSTAAFSVKINADTNAAINCAPQENSSSGVATPAFLAMLCSGVTKLFFTNPSATESITIDVTVAGD